MATNQQKLDRIENGKATWHAQIPIGGKGAVSAEMRLYWADVIGNQNRATLARIEASQKNMLTALARVAGGETFDEAKLLAGINATLKESQAELVASIGPAVQKALEGLDISAEVLAAVMNSIRSITTTTTAEIKEPK